MVLEQRKLTCLGCVETYCNPVITHFMRTQIASRMMNPAIASVQDREIVMSKIIHGSEIQSRDHGRFRVYVIRICGTSFPHASVIGDVAIFIPTRRDR